MYHAFFVGLKERYSWGSSSFLFVLALTGIIASVVLFGIFPFRTHVPAVSHRLPNLPTAFTGRDEKVHEILELMLSDINQVKVVAITGGPGYGKSSLAIVCAYEFSKTYSIRVHYVSLTEVETIPQLVMKILLSVNDTSVDQKPDQSIRLLSYIGTLEHRCIFILDNADHLTLANSVIMSNFLKLLKKMISSSSSLQLLVTTRYRFKMLDNFKEIHLQPLSNSSTVELLQRLMLPSGLFSTEDALLIPTIANLTGGIPLAVKVICQLLISQTLSVKRVIEGLSSHPIHMLSQETFSPEEQLNRCFNLSYTYLSPVAKKCFVYTARFPSAFDQEAGNAVIVNLTNDADCLAQLIDRSLLEYNAHSERYNMHSLLRHFVEESVHYKFRKQRYFQLYVSHYVDRLLALIHDVSSESVSHVNRFYSTLSIDYYHFLHAFELLANNHHRPLLSPDSQLQFAIKSFHVIQARFPRKLLINWWVKVLYDTCHSGVDLDLRHPASMAPMFISFTKKLGYLYQFQIEDLIRAKGVYEIAVKCVKSKNHVILSRYYPTALESLCSAVHKSSYIELLQSLKDVYKELGLARLAHDVAQTIKLCMETLESDPQADYVSLIKLLPEEEKCSEGLPALRRAQYKYISFYSLFRYEPIKSFVLLVSKCSGFEAAVEELFHFETLFVKYTLQHGDQLKHGHTMITLSKLWRSLDNTTQEVHWLLKGSVLYLKIQNSEVVLFEIHFRLARLFFIKLNKVSEALKHAKLSYEYAVSLSETGLIHDFVFRAAFRLADILYLADMLEEATVYYQEAVDLLPFINSDESSRFQFQRSIEAHLIHLLLYQKRFDKLLMHYGQWTKIELSANMHSLRAFMDEVYKFSQPFHHSSYQRDIDVVDDTLARITGPEVAKLVNCINAMLYTWLIRISILIQIVLIILILGLILIICLCFDVLFSLGVTLCNIPCLFIVFVPVTFLYRRFIAIHYSFHYFLYCAIVNGKLWLPSKLPSIPRFVWMSYMFTLCFVLLLSIVVVYVGTFFTSIVIVSHNSFVSSDTFHNVSMLIVDDLM